MGTGTGRDATQIAGDALKRFPDLTSEQFDYSSILPGAYYTLKAVGSSVSGAHFDQFRPVGS